MKERRFLALLMSCSVLCAIAPATRAFADEGKKKGPRVVETKAVKGGEVPPTAAGDNNDPAAKMEAPANKGGAKTRGGPGWCTVKIDNWTPWKIKIFVDNDYKGVVPGLGDGTTAALSGRTTFYAVATFIGQDVFSWGPSYFDCADYGTFTWKLTN